MDSQNFSKARQQPSPGVSLDDKTATIGSERSLILDVIRLSRDVPSFPVERWFDVAEVAEARDASPLRVSWVTLFAKAYSLACRDVAEMRRFYISFPWPRFFQSSKCVVSVAINRVVDDRNRLFFGRLRWPERKTLLQIQDELDGYIDGDITEVFRKQLLNSYIPRPLRRVGWWCRNNLQPGQRARRTGTGSISVLSGVGVMNRLHPCMLPSSLSYGPLENDGRMWVTLQCDHRVIDGTAAARAINLMHDYLRGEVLSELKDLKVPANRVA